jgi:tRNA(Met) cytidine acetyltransferase
LLNAEPAPDEQVAALMQQQVHAIGADSLKTEQLDRDQLAGDEALLRQVFGLLVLGHYQTRPADLRHLLDGPNMQVSVLRSDGCVLATALTAHEGQLPKQLLEPIYDGRRRPRGHLLPQTLSAHAGLFDAPRLGYTRIVRIAVHPAARGLGLGTWLVRALAESSRAQGRDLLGASFGATPELVRFWRHSGLLPVQLGCRRNAASGAHSLVVLSGLSDAGDALAEQARRQLVPHLQVLLAGPLRLVDAAVIAEMLCGAPSTDLALDRTDRRILGGFADANRGFAAALPSLHRLTISALPRALASNTLTKDQAAALITYVLQHRDWTDLNETSNLRGQKALLRLLRSATGTLLACLPSGNRSQPGADG